MPRPSIDERFLRQAMVIATGSTCVRRAVGCITVDDHNHQLSSGYNGVSAGMPHCNEEGGVRGISKLECPGSSVLSGEGLEGCAAVHAEINALIQCPDVMKIRTIYCTTQPCASCMKAIANTGCLKVVYIEPYNDPTGIRDAIADYKRITQLQLAVFTDED
jgi:dCMP deaminase